MKSIFPGDMIIILSLLFLTGSCSCSKKIAIKFDEDPSVVKESIKKLIPIGSGIDSAETIMSQNSFTCRYMKKSAFLDNENFYHNIDFLYCDRSRGFLISRRWQVAIVYENQKVVDIHVSTGLTGP